MSNFCPMSDALAIKAALAAAPSFRRAKVTDGLYRISDLKPFRRLTHGIPHLKTTHHRPGNFEAQRAVSDEVFRWRFEDVAARHLRGFDLAAHGMCVAGGAVSACLMRDPSPPHDFERFFDGFGDVDVFLVGDQPEEVVRENIRKLGLHLQQHAEKGHIDVYRTVNCITFCGRPAEYSAGDCVHEVKTFSCEQAMTAVRSFMHRWVTDVDGQRWALSPDQFTVQVILRRYSTPGEVIHGFDLGSCAALWDGSKVLMTRMSVIAAEHGANVLDLTIRRPSYERRLSRYFARGYDLVLPDLDVEALVKAGGGLPFLGVYLDRTIEHCACAASAYSIEVPNSAAPVEDADADEIASVTQSYAPHGSPPYGDFEMIRRTNLAWMISGKAGCGPLCASAVFSPELQLFDIEPEPSTPQEFYLYVKSASHLNCVKMHTLQRVFGLEAALVFLKALVERKERGDRRDYIQERCEQRLKTVPRRTIPLRFLTVEENMTAASSASVSRETWYGPLLQKN